MEAGTDLPLLFEFQGGWVHKGRPADKDPANEPPEGLAKERRGQEGNCPEKSRH